MEYAFIYKLYISYIVPWGSALGYSLNKKIYRKNILRGIEKISITKEKYIALNPLMSSNWDLLKYNHR